MEENLMERLLNDFNGVLEEFNQLVENKDIEGVKKVLDEVNRLIQERDGIVLDDREPQYDHVLHELLSKMGGVIELVESTQGIDFEPGTRVYTNVQVQVMITNLEKELTIQAEKLRTGKDEENAQMIGEAEAERQRLLSEIEKLQEALVPDQEYSTLTYIDEDLKALQEERARLIQEKMNNLKEIARLKGEETPSIAANSVDQARLDEINSRITELEGSIPDLESQINDIKSTNISQVIDNLRGQTANRAELQANLEDLRKQLTAVGNRVRETRGEDAEYAIARAEFSRITSEIANLENQLTRANQAEENISFLESLRPETQEVENVLDAQDYTYMGRLSDEQIIRRLLSEQLHLSNEEIDQTIGDYSLVQAENGSHDEHGEEEPISMRQLVRTKTTREDITVGQAIENLEAVLHDGPVVDHSQEISEIDNRITELDEIISDAQSKIDQIRAQQISEIIEQSQENARKRTELQANLEDLRKQLTAVGNRVRETRGEDAEYAIARAEFSRLTSEIADVENQLSQIEPDDRDIEYLESLIPTREEKETVLEPQDYTYMGRLSDEQIIRRLLSEQLHLSNEEIDQTIGEYSLVQAENGAHDEHGEDNPISMKQLVKTTIVKEPITVEEAYKTQTADLEQKLDDLRKQLTAVGNRVRETRGEDTEYAIARAEFSRLTSEIADVENQLKEAKAKFNKEVGIGEQEDRITAAKKEQEELRARKTELEQDDSRQENPEVRDRLNKLKEITGIAALETQLQQCRDELDKLKEERDSLSPTQGKSGVDNSVRIAELETRNKEIIIRIDEIDREIKEIPGVHIPGSESKDSFDITAEVNRIGDNIFKTAKIRRELAEREVSRDEFLEFYQAGLDMTRQQINGLAAERQKVLEEMKAIIVDTQSGESLHTQIANAIKAGDKELTTTLLEQLRKNFITAGREDQLKEMGLDHEITSPEDVNKMKEFYKNYRKSCNESIKKIDSSKTELQENAQIFITEMSRIKLEKNTLELAGESLEELDAKSETRKDLRRKLLEASITPEADLTDEQVKLLETWQEASERFLSKKALKEFTYIDKDGNEQHLEVDTIDSSYAEYKTDIEFLGVPAYKENLEQLSAYEQTQDPYVFGEEVGRAYDEAEATREGAGEEVIRTIMTDKQKYVETFNGIPNPHKVKYENWKTAGSTLKGMKPVSRDLPAPTRTKNALENVGRFFGIRVPKFTRIDDHGNEVRDVKGGIATVALDAAVIGAVAGTALTVGPAIAAVGYAAKGIVTAGNRIAARIEYSRHKDEIDNNKPVINQADRNAREVARKAYYREQGDNRLVAWAKAKSDKYFTRGREKDTELAIVDGLMTDFEEKEIERTEALKQNIQIARANQIARQTRQKQVAMSANTYNDIVRDPDSVDMDKATAAIARNAALEANKPGKGIEDVNASSTATRKEQYVKQEGPVAKTEDLYEEAFEDPTAAPVSAITMEQIYTGRKQHVDRLNKVLTAITAAGLKFGYTAWRDGFTKTEIVHHDAEYKDETVHHDAEVGEVKTPIYEKQYDTSKTLEELRKNYAGKTTDEYYSVSGGLRGQRTEALVDKPITAIWGDDKSTWGTGISDTQGLSAPTLTERLADANLIDPNGLLRQDISVQKLLNALNCKNTDLTTLDGIYASVGDNYWVSLSDLMKGMTKDVITGYKTETGIVKEAWDETVQTLVKEAWDEEIKTFAPGAIVDAVKDGVIAGAAVGAADALHESVQTTYIDGATPGRPEETTPEATDSFEKIAEQLQAKSNRERQRRQEEKEQNEGEQEQDR